MAAIRTLWQRHWRAILIMAALVAVFVWGLTKGMPGIPPDGTPQAQVFWSSFWPALYSGILYSFVMGLTVGLVVMFTQNHLEQARVQHRFQREIAQLREELRGIVSKRDVPRITTATQSTPPAALGIVKQLEERPLDLWLESVPKWKSFLALLRRTEQAHSRFVQAAEALDTQLSPFIRRHNAARGAIAANDAHDHAFFIGRVLGIDDADLLAFIDSSTARLPTLQESCNAASQVPGMSNSVRLYLEARRELCGATEALERDLSRSGV
jgi:hypothetical protein